MPWSFSRQRRAAVSAAAAQEPAGGRVDLAELLDQTLGRAEQLAVDVQLPLVPGAVADPYRAAAAPAVQVGQHPLGEVAFAADAEHDLQVGPLVKLRGGRAGQEVEELVGLVGAGGHPQGLHGEAGVPHPGVAVVPVALAADRLRQRGGRRGHDRPGRLEGERLQHPAGVVHQLPPGVLVALVQRRPGAPARHGVLQAGGDLLLGPDPRRRLPAAGVVQGEAGRLPRPQGEPGAGGVAVDLELHRGRQQQPVGAAAGGEPAVHRLQQRVDQAVLRPRGVRHRRSTSPSVQVSRRSSSPGEPAPSSWPRSLRPTASASTSTAVPPVPWKVVSRAIVWSR